jgi:formylglycine-generating enzyme required for sulfatase activity
MSTHYRIDDARGNRRLHDDDFPLVLGGPESDFELSSEGRGQIAIAYLGLTDGDVFVQGDDDAGAGGITVSVNGRPLNGSQWLENGDILRCGRTRVEVEVEDDQTRFVVRHGGKDAAVPVLKPPPRAKATAATGATIQPVEFQPKGLAGSPSSGPPTRRTAPRSRRTTVRPAFVLSAVLLLVLVATAGFTFTARSVLIDIEPAAERLEVLGFLAGFKIGDRHLLLPGTYTVKASKPGYRGFEESVEVTRDARQGFDFVLERLPGTLRIQTTPGAVVTLDGEALGAAPLPAIELASGAHEVRIQAARYEDFTATVEIEGAGTDQILEAELLPRWAAVLIRSEPSGAAVRVDNSKVGTTPLTTEVLAGGHGYEVVLDGYKPRRGRFQVTAREPQALTTLRLDPTDGMLVVRSDPQGATVTVAGVYKGTTPLDVELAPGQSYEVQVSKAGFEPASRELQIRSGETHEVDLPLVSRQGEVRVAAWPPEAQLYVNGEARGAASQTLSLAAVPQQIEIRLAGFQPFRQKLIPMPGVSQSIEVTLETAEQIREKLIRPVIETSEGHTLRLIQPGGRFTLGASRREPGRRANEALRQVELTRRFYLGTEEVENRQFRRFKNEHLSGQVSGASLETDHHPAVRLSWEDAAAYCNWLSQKEGLPVFYVRRGATYAAAEPTNNGYRLPTEAEWSWVARFSNGEAALKYPWGKSLPIPSGSGNYADEKAREVVPSVVAGYDDGFAATAPTTQFEPNALGIRNLGGNVAEWVHDLYKVYPVGGGQLEKDPIGPVAGEFHVIRGSSWMHSTVTELRLTFRDYAKESRPDVGLRIARYVD